VDVEPERVEADRGDERRGAQADDAVAPFDLERGGLGERVDTDREGRRVVERTAAADRDPHDVVADDVDAQLLVVHGRQQAAVRGRDRAHALEAHVVVRVDHAAVLARRPGRPPVRGGPATRRWGSRTSPAPG
jgi:hypothetical protein